MMIDTEKKIAQDLMRPKGAGSATQAEQLLEKLLRSALFTSSDLDALPDASRADLARHSHAAQLLARLVDFQLLTPYQADQVRSGNIQALVLGDYRVLDRLGVGNDGVVFRGKHWETGQKVAIKVLIPARDRDSKSKLRFFAERKTVAQLSHPGIVRVLDVGETTPDDPDKPVLYFYVMELVPGLDLEQYIQKNGPMPPSLACDVAYQICDALTEAQKHNLVHRDIKPSNILLTPDERAMLLDFGLVRQSNSRQTEMGSLVGVLEWIAPEQRKDARAVDIRADIYSLGCTLFWCLTGTLPYRGKGSPQEGPALMPAQPPSVRGIRADIARELDALVARMMALAPDDRYADPQAVMAALLPFVPEKRALAANFSQPLVMHTPFGAAPTMVSTRPILLVDHDAAALKVCRATLQDAGLIYEEAGDGALALRAIAAAEHDLVLLGMDLPGMTGLEVLKKLREDPLGANQKIIMLIANGADIRPFLAAGADDYLTKPLDPALLLSRVKTALHLKETQDALPEPLAPTPPEIPTTAPPAPATFWQTATGWLRGSKKQNTAP